MAHPTDSRNGRSRDPPLVALTGATGFVGGALLAHLTGAGRRVRALYRGRAGRTPTPTPGVEWIAGDLGDLNSLQALVTGADAVIHCAGAVRGAGSSGFERINAEGAGSLARLTSSHARSPRFLLMSSLAARMPALSDYAASKRHGEDAVATAAANLRWTILRPPAVYGPGEREMRALFRWVARGVAPLPAGSVGRFSLLYVDDLATAALSWLAADTGDGSIFELDDGHPGGYDWDTVLTIAARVLRKEARVRRIALPMPLLRAAAWANLAAGKLGGFDPMLTPGKLREISHPDWLCDSHDFAEATGWRAAVGLELGLARAYGGNPQEP